MVNMKEIVDKVGIPFHQGMGEQRVTIHSFNEWVCIVYLLLYSISYYIQALLEIWDKNR